MVLAVLGTVEALKMRQQALVGVGNMLRNRTDLGHYRHIIMIISPARYDVVVEVVINTGAGNPSHVQAYVEAVGLEFIF